MERKIDGLETVELYARYGALIARRVAGRLIDGFRATFTIDATARHALFREHGIALTKKGRYGAAAAVLEPLHRSRPDDGDVMLHLGLCCLKTGRPEEGFALLERVQALRGDVRSATVLGIAYCQAGRDAQAIPLLRRVADAMPDHFTVRYRLGVAYDNTGQHDKAVECLQEALELRPDDARVHRAIGFAYEQKGAHETAVGYFRRASELEDSHAGAGD